ncbi:hypothetical protein TSUD_159350 [Trifolium subterraneum]|uniref:Uncharacterized protein n=1 Tax=Trifolium subterraneum TaxID=3900 RepID=A0A2Z6MFC9_TRISU|nr:hypothetical protein TSUD_159350 [Trifolium subterraneum]
MIMPEINPNAHRSENSWKNRTEIQSPLLPGLPDDVAIACLIRVPRSPYMTRQPIHGNCLCVAAMPMVRAINICAIAMPMVGLLQLFP